MADRIELCNADKCTGCFACVNVCPKQCISMRTSADGSIIPIIFHDQCVGCRSCQRVCPVLSEVKLRTPSSVYAAYSNDTEIHNNSASGGVATELAMQFIQSGGIVYGAAQTSELKVEHIRVSDESTVCRLQGSKYVHSHVGLQYQSVKKDLQSGYKVLFVGTPCEVAGLKNFLHGGEYSNLYCVDIVCHGVPTWNTFLECMQSETKIKDFGSCNISFRDSDGFEIKIRSKDGKILSRRNLKNSLYYNGFMEGYIYRQNCYTCRYAQEKRCGDITLGDFWGLGAIEKFDGDTSHGINAVLINTERGKELFETIKQKLSYWERSLDEAVSGNGQLRHPSPDSKEHRRFLSYSQKYDRARAVTLCNPTKTVKLYLRRILNESRLTHSIVRHIPGLKRKI